MQSQNYSQSADAQSIDTVFRLLRDRRRRYVVALLSKRDAEISLTELAERVVSWESEADPEGVPAARTEEMAVALHHTHLPKLARAGVVEYDGEAETVAPGRVERLAGFLSAADAAPETAE